MYLVRIKQSEKKFTAKSKEANLHHSARKRYYTNKGLQKHGFRITATWRLEKMVICHQQAASSVHYTTRC